MKPNETDVEYPFILCEMCYLKMDITKRGYYKSRVYSGGNHYCFCSLKCYENWNSIVWRPLGETMEEFDAHVESLDIKDYRYPNGIRPSE